MFNLAHSSISEHYDCIGLELVQKSVTGQAIYLEYVAYPSVARAVSAYLTGAEHRTSSNLRWMGDIVVYFGEGTRLWAGLRRLPCGMDHVIIAHQGVGAGGLVPDIFLIADGDSVPANFGPRLKQALPLGILEEATPLAALWERITSQAGQARYRAIARLPSQGDLQLWEITTLNAQVWRGICWDYLKEHPWHAR